MIDYICGSCNTEHSFDKPRVRCPSCKKHALLPKIVSKTPPQEEHTTQIKRPSDNKRKVVYDDDGNQIGTYTRTEPIGEFKNNFKHDNEAYQNDRDSFDKLVKWRMSPRERVESRKTSVTCSHCGNSFEIPSNVYNKYYVCAKCASRRVIK